MSNYTTTKIMDNFYSIELNSMVRSFLFIGEEDALLVDTCTGEGDILAEIKKLTDLPVSVIFTHSDGDHVGAAKYFEDCFMHPSEFDYYKSKTDDPVEMIPIWEGDGLDIGTFSFEVILIPGHTPGSIALLEPDKNFLIGGDSIQTGGRNFEAFRAIKTGTVHSCSDRDVISKRSARAWQNSKSTSTSSVSSILRTTILKYCPQRSASSTTAQDKIYDSCDHAYG